MNNEEGADKKKFVAIKPLHRQINRSIYVLITSLKIATQDNFHLLQEKLL